MIGIINQKSYFGFYNSFKANECRSYWKKWFL